MHFLGLFQCKTNYSIAVLYTSLILYLPFLHKSYLSTLQSIDYIYIYISQFQLDISKIRIQHFTSACLALAFCSLRLALTSVHTPSNSGALEDRTGMAQSENELPCRSPPATAFSFSSDGFLGASFGDVGADSEERLHIN